MKAIEKVIEYEVTYEDHDVDHIKWWEAKKMIANPPDNVILIERVTRYGYSDGNDENEDRKKYETLFERDEAVQGNN